jgi:spermidine synthase
MGSMQAAPSSPVSADLRAALHEASGREHTLLRLFILSAAALYVEIVLIRWISTEVRVFAFVQNLALIACFLGFGLGCYGSKRRGSLLPSLLAITVLVVMVHLPVETWKVVLSGLSEFLTMSPDAALWGGTAHLTLQQFALLSIFAIALVATFLLLLIIAMVPLGQWVGHYVDTSSHAVTAYSVNLAGSIVGIWLLAFLAFAWLSPTFWFATAFVLLALARPTARSVLIAAAMFLVVMSFFLQTRAGSSTFWSPYQKLQLTPLGGEQYQIDVSNSGYMSIANLTPEFLAGRGETAENYRDSSYDGPFRFVAKKDRVLIIGAGAGNDAAAALRNGARWIDAVEIDPVIYSLGERFHPEHPYASPRVHKVINDARNFLRQPHETYDVIIFALLDSHTEFSGYSSMRVDNYVYTEEAFREARKLLNPEGVLILKFEVRHPWTWIGQRLFVMLERVFQHPPITYYSPQLHALFSGTVFIESNSPVLWSRAAEPANAVFLSNHAPAFSLSSAGAPSPTTDDWPYIYHRGHFIPRTYMTVSVILLIMAVLMARPVFRPRQASTWEFFFLGAAFLLLETQLVSRLALYFGTTWLVNCIALTAILGVLLLANCYVTWHTPACLPPYYVLLILGLVAIYFFPWSHLPLSGTAIGVLLSFGYCIPVFFAGVIFAERFRSCIQRSDAFGANIMGAVAGGLAQNLSFIFGMKALLLVAGAFYLGAAFLGAPGDRALGSAAAEPEFASR